MHFIGSTHRADASVAGNTDPKRTRHCEEGHGPDAPQGGLSCPCGAIHLLAIPKGFRLPNWCFLLSTGLPRGFAPRNDVVFFICRTNDSPFYRTDHGTGSVLLRPDVPLLLPDSMIFLLKISLPIGSFILTPFLIDVNLLKSVKSGDWRVEILTNCQKSFKIISTLNAPISNLIQ